VRRDLLYIFGDGLVTLAYFGDGRRVQNKEMEEPGCGKISSQ